MLRVDNISKNFGGIKAVDSVSFEIKHGSITALIGPNGSGKTTVFNVISGYHKPQSGWIYYQKKNITSLPPFEIAALGIGRSFQTVKIFPQISVLDNVMLATKYPTGEQLTSAVLQSRWMRDEENENRKKSIDFLKLVGLNEKKDLMAGQLSFGQKKLLEIARLLALDADLLLLDEPTAGLFPGMIIITKQILKELQKSGKTILFIEHNMDVVMDISEKIIVLDHGKKIAEGTVPEIQKNKTVINAYLGRGILNAP